MNQILVVNNNFIRNQTKIKKIRKYKFIFSFSTCIFIALFSYWLYSYFYIKLTHNFQTNLLKYKYNINSLYSSDSNYSTLKLSNNVSIIGLIEIPKINISYPIIEKENKELLKISVCRFYGPLPNRKGNLCIAGHNYKNNLMFSNLYKLNIGDSILIKDLNNTQVEYIVYNKFKVKENNWNCIKSFNQVEITLITCDNNDNSERTVIKAKMKG